MRMEKTNSTDKDGRESPDLVISSHYTKGTFIQTNADIVLLLYKIETTQQ